MYLIKQIVWGLPTVFVIAVFGVYFTVRSGFYRPRAVASTVRDTLVSLFSHKGDGISPLAAVATALGGTVGIGSIVGVGYAISEGGAGSIFWMWVCSFFGMGLKYAEVRIALNGRKMSENGFIGGAPYRLGQLGYGRLAVAFCIICLLASFGTGNLTQINSVSGLLEGMGMPSPLCALACVAIVAAAVLGGRRRISRINLFLVPTASAVYLIVCVAVIALNARAIPSALGTVLREAFGISAIGHGVSGAMLAHVVREGFARSMFSNEAGMGSSPLAHATSSESDPDVQAKWGIFEIFFDTFVVSTLTALALLTSGTSGVSDVFSQFAGGAGVLLFSLLSAVFAFASVISWCYYAECCIDYLFPKRAVALWTYRTVFSLVAALGVLASDSMLWALSDVLNALMTIPNLFLLYKCRKEIERIG